MQDETFDLGRAFYGKEDVLRCLLETGRQVATHPGAKGDSSELHWKEMLSAFLPQRYQVSKGFVVDSAGWRSEQIDVIISVEADRKVDRKTERQQTIFKENNGI